MLKRMLKTDSPHVYQYYHPRFIELFERLGITTMYLPAPIPKTILMWRKSLSGLT